MSDQILGKLIDRLDELHASRVKPKQWKYLRPSELGHECWRYLFMSFRWASTPKPVEGKLKRIFDRGQREEVELMSYLRDVGLTVSEKDESTDQQWSVTSVGGHCFGFLDGAGNDHDRIQIDTGHWFVIEAKTHNKKNFDRLEKEGVQKSHIKHYAQMQWYAGNTGMVGALYVAKCKDDERVTMRYFHFNDAYYRRLNEKAHRIVFSDIAPDKLSLDSNYFGCRFCSQREVCHGIDGKLPLRNCRTCMHVTAVVDGKWLCRARNKELSSDDQRAGCGSHRWLPSLINGQQLDTGPSGHFIQYKMPNGRTLIDGGPE